MPKFSVVIPVYNKARFLAETLDSVVKQRFEDIEVLLLDDGSTDNSYEIMESYTRDPRFRIFQQENRGVSASRNYLIEKASAPYIALLDADDLWHPDYLQLQHQMVQTYPEARVFATASKIKRGNTSQPRSYNLPEGFGAHGLMDYFEGSTLDSLLHSSTTVLHKEVFREVGNYNEAYRSGEDTDLYVRIGLKYPVVFNKKVLVTYRVVDDGLVKSSRSVHEKANFEAYEPYEKSNTGLKRFLDLNRYSLCLHARLEGDETAFQNIYQKIDPTNLSKRQRYLLNQSRDRLKSLFKLKESLQRLGIRLKSFKR